MTKSRHTEVRGTILNSCAVISSVRSASGIHHLVLLYNWPIVMYEKCFEFIIIIIHEFKKLMGVIRLFKRYIYSFGFRNLMFQLLLQLGPSIKYVTLEGEGVREGVTVCDRGRG